MNNDNSFDPRSYWENRLRSNPNLRGVGHRRFSISYNKVMYRVAIHNLALALAQAGIDIKGKRILDIGSGLGHFIEYYVMRGATHITGLDITQTSVETLSLKYPQHKFFCADVSEPTTPLTNVYQVVSAINVLFHITDASRFKQAIRNMCEKTDSQGYLILVDSFYKKFAVRTTHAHPRTISEYIPLLREGNFEVILLHPMYFLMGQSTFPFLLPSLFSNPVILKLLEQGEYWLSQSMSVKLSSMQYMIARRLK